MGVHIADVTHFVRPDTPIDYEASQRGVTVYLTDRRIDMFFFFHLFVSLSFLILPLKTIEKIKVARIIRN